MATGLRLKEITISGFRGYSEIPRTLDLSRPAVILTGGNRSGKSSTMNAIEWAVYGDEIVGKGKVGIEERKGWLVKNRNSPKARVELVLGSTAGEIKIVRETGQGKSKKGHNFFYVDEAGKQHTDQASLWNRLGLGPRDFMSSVYLHQEVIRDMIVSPPALREEALDRLLGVSHLRNLFEAFKEVKVGNYEKEITSIYENIEILVESRASSYSERIREEMETGKELGIATQEFSKSGLKARGEAVLGMLHEQAKKAKVKKAAITPPTGAEDYEDFLKQVKHETDRPRIEGPAVESQRALHDRRRELNSSLSEYLDKQDELDEILEEQKEIEKQSGPLKSIAEKKGKLEKSVQNLSSELGEISDRINVVDETVDFLEKISDRKAKAKCPACQQEIVPEELLESLMRFKNEVRTRTERLEQRKREERYDQKLWMWMRA